MTETSGSKSLDAAISLDELWGAIPNLDRADGLGAGQTPRFVVDSGTAGQLVVRNERGSLMEDPEEFLRHLDEFPQLAKSEINHHMQGRWAVITLDFPDGQSEPDFLAHSGVTADSDTGSEGRNPPSTLMLWWCLLQALSQLARVPARGLDRRLDLTVLVSPFHLKQL